MKSKESFGYKLGVFLGGCAISPFMLLIIVPSIAWWVFWGAKISVALTAAFGWPLLTFTKSACLVLVARFLSAKYEDTQDNDTVKRLAFTVITPALFWLAVITFIWLGGL